jgi:hypothetical protein
LTLQDNLGAGHLPRVERLTKKGLRVMPVFNFTTIDVPLADDTEVSGINGGGQIVGSYLVGSTPKASS